MMPLTPKPNLDIILKQTVPMPNLALQNQLGNVRDNNMQNSQINSNMYKEEGMGGVKIS